MANIIQANCLLCRMKSDIFNTLQESELQRVNECRVSMIYHPGEILFKQGSPCHDFVCVTSGLVKLYLEGEGDRRIIIGFARPIDYIFEPGAFSDRRHHFTAVACTETSVCLVGAESIQELIRTNPDFSNSFNTKISQQVIHLFKHITTLTQKQMPGRIAEALLYLSEEVYESNSFITNLSRQDIADLAGMTKESAIRSLKAFKDDGIITTEGPSITILDKPKLMQISKNG